MNVKSKEKELGSFIGRLLREHFGKGPGAVFATIAKPYVTMYIKDFLSPIEANLIAKKKNTYVQKIRDTLMEALIDQITAYIQENLGFEIQEFYYDWNLFSQSGMFVGIGSKEDVPLIDEPYPNQEMVHQEMVKVSEEAEKVPGSVHSYLLNPRTLVIVRTGILISIEKELHALEFSETLIVAKRNLEKRLLHHHKKNFEAYLHSHIEDTFTSWNFDLDKSETTFILQPYK